MLTLKVTTHGEAATMSLPPEAMARLDVREGDIVVLAEAPGGGYTLGAAGPAFKRQMALAESIMREDREVLSALAR